jgi:hypothetical protein
MLISHKNVNITQESYKENKAQAVLCTYQKILNLHIDNKHLYNIEIQQEKENILEIIELLIEYHNEY